MGKWIKYFSRSHDREFALANARRDLFVLIILIAAVAMLIWNGSELFLRLSIAGGELGADIKVIATALTLNIALILFGWRRYVDLVHAAEMRHESEARAAHLASTDAITGLFNRKGFADRVEVMRQKAIASGHRLAILSIQLNRFKAVNDRHGYDTGDAMMRLIANELGNGRGVGDRVVARLAGDEFAIAFPATESDMDEVQKEAERLLCAITRPMEVDGKMIQVGAFLGIHLGDPDEGQLPDHLRRADIALDRARSTRTIRPVWFDEGMERALVAHGEIEQGIRHGLEHGQFIPHFEPQVDLLSGEVVGFEVLARWDHPLRGIVGPDVFIPVAEEHGLIGRLSEQVMLSAFNQATEWDPAISLSVNISPSQLADSWLAHRIVRLLTESGFPAERLVVELTESSLFSDIDLARSIVTSLKNQGIRLALDDFGSGFSSLSHLRALPFDMIKIDRSFVSLLDKERENVAIVRAVTTLAEAIGVPVTAEGIEDIQAHKTLVGLGCAVGQGWYFGKPMNGEQVTAMLRHKPEPAPHFRASRAG